MTRHRNGVADRCPYTAGFQEKELAKIGRGREEEAESRIFALN